MMLDVLMTLVLDNPYVNVTVDLWEMDITASLLVSSIGALLGQEYGQKILNHSYPMRPHTSCKLFCRIISEIFIYNYK